MAYYIIHYEVDTGWEYRRDDALVKAMDENEAVKKLNSYISSIGNDYMVSEVFFVKEFTGDVFSSNYIPKRKG